MRRSDVTDGPVRPLSLRENGPFAACLASHGFLKPRYGVRGCSRKPRRIVWPCWQRNSSDQVPSLVVRQPTRGELLRIQFFGELPEVMSIVAFLFPSAERMVGGAPRSGFDDFKRYGRQRADQVADLASFSVFFGDRGFEGRHWRSGCLSAPAWPLRRRRAARRPAPARSTTRGRRRFPPADRSIRPGSRPVATPGHANLHFGGPADGNFHRLLAQDVHRALERRGAAAGGLAGFFAVAARAASSRNRKRSSGTSVRSPAGTRCL